VGLADQALAAEVGGAVEHGERIVDRDGSEVRADRHLGGDLVPIAPRHRRHPIGQLVDHRHRARRLPEEERD
jgi:hypothetical protein